MIIAAIVVLSLVVLGAIAAIIVNVPVIPTNILEYMTTFTTYTNMGIKIFFSFVYDLPVKAMLVTSLGLGLVIKGYNFVMWVAKKIPMLGVSK